MKNTLLGRGILLPTGEISKDFVVFNRLAVALALASLRVDSSMLRMTGREKTM